MPALSSPRALFYIPFAPPGFPFITCHTGYYTVLMGRNKNYPDLRVASAVALPQALVKGLARDLEYSSDP